MRSASALVEQSSNDNKTAAQVGRVNFMAIRLGWRLRRQNGQILSKALVPQPALVALAKSPVPR